MICVYGKDISHEISPLDKLSAQHSFVTIDTELHSSSLELIHLPYLGGGNGEFSLN